MTTGTLKLGEVHPMASDAMEFIQSIPFADKMMWLESFASCAIDGNRTAEILGETLRRVIEGEPVSDRYLLGLAWALRKVVGETA